MGSGNSYSDVIIRVTGLTERARGAPLDHGGPFCRSDHREGNLTRSRYHRLSVIQRFNVLCDPARSGSDANLEVAAGNSLAPQFAHFDDNVATHEAAELGRKAPLTTNEQSPEAFPDCHNSFIEAGAPYSSAH